MSERRPASRGATVRIIHGELRPASGFLKASYSVMDFMVVYGMQIGRLWASVAAARWLRVLPPCGRLVA